MKSLMARNKIDISDEMVGNASKHIVKVCTTTFMVDHVDMTYTRRRSGTKSVFHH